MSASVSCGNSSLSRSYCVSPFPLVSPVAPGRLSSVRGKQISYPSPVGQDEYLAVLSRQIEGLH